MFSAAEAAFYHKVSVNRELLLETHTMFSCLRENYLLNAITGLQFLPHIQGVPNVKCPDLRIAGFLDFVQHPEF
jgi:hypothetical protein